MKMLIHIPKTGGSTSVRNAGLKRSVRQPADDVLDVEYKKTLEAHARSNNHSPAYGHCRWKDLNSKTKKNFQCFAIIRNPWSKLVSQFLFSHQIYKDAIAVGRPANKPIGTFDAYLKQYDGIVNIPYNWHRTTKNFQQQFDYVTDDSGILKCDILRFEKYNDDTMKYFKILKPLAPRNISNGKKGEFGVFDKKDYKSFYNHESIEMVAKWFKKDIAFFGFSFDSTATKNIWNDQ